MKVALVTDAWHPQSTDVVRTLASTVERLRAEYVTVEVISRQGFHSVPYREIRRSLFAGRGVARRLESFDPDAVHVATEGPLGLAARRWCLAHAAQFTTAYHTQFPEYLRARMPVPLSASDAFLRWVRGAATRTLVATPATRRQLEAQGFGNLTMWSRGVDEDVFRLRDKFSVDLPRPIWLYVGRVALETGIEDFLHLDLPGTQLVVGDGPARAALERRYSRARFVGCKHGEDLARQFAASDVLVFPSRTDAFGLVLLEAMACGLPVAAYPVPGPIDVLAHGVTGILDEDLQSAALRALRMDPAACREHALGYTWEASTRLFLNALARKVPGCVRPAVA